MDYSSIKTVVAHIRENARPVLLIMSCAVLFAVIVFNVHPRGLFTIQSAAAVGGYNASDALGQLDENGSPVYTNAIGNNAPNHRGFSPADGVAIDSINHRVFVADRLNNRVLVFELDAGNELVDRNAKYVLGQSSYKNSSSATTASGLNAPVAVAFDEVANRLFVADRNNSRVLVYDTTSITNGEDAVNVLGQTDFTTPTAGTTQGKLIAPNGLVLNDAGTLLYVADNDNNRVMVFDVAAITDGEDAVNVLGQTDFVTWTAGTTQGKLTRPVGLALDSTGNRLFVSDRDNNRVMVFDVGAITDGEDAVNVLGQTDFFTATGGTTQSKLSMPLGMDFDAANSLLYVADRLNNRVMVFDVAAITDGEDATDVYGQSDFITATSGITQSKFSNAIGVTWDGDGSTLYISDGASNRILLFGSSPPTPTPTPPPAPGGHSHQEPPASIGFFPDKIVINSDDTSTDSKNVLMSVYAHYSADFTGTVDVLLSNTPDFAAVIPFRYAISASGTNTAWPKTIAWDLCFGLPATTPCNPGSKTVYARFYVNLPNVWPALTPLAPLEQAITR